MTVETPTVPMSVLDKAIAETNENQKKYTEKLVARIQALHDAYNKMKEAGVKGIPDELNTYHLTCGMNIEVKEASEWGKIHKAVGKLTVYDKQPVREDDDTKKKGRKVQMINIVLAPEGYGHPLYYSLHFTTQRKLTKNDRCQVKVVTRKEVQVVCGVKS